MAALFAALSYIGFAVFRIDVPIGPMKTAFHFGNTFVILGALFMGGWYGGLAGAIGLTVADLTTGYVIYAPTTFLLKLAIGLICGFVAHRVGKIREKTGAMQTRWAFRATTAAMLFNVIVDPLVSYLRILVLTTVGVTEIAGKPLKEMTLAQAVAKMSAVTTLVNAAITIAVVTLSYATIARMMKNTGVGPGVKEGRDEKRK